PSCTMRVAEKSSGSTAPRLPRESRSRAASAAAAVTLAAERLVKLRLAALVCAQQAVASLAYTNAYHGYDIIGCKKDKASCPEKFPVLKCGQLVLCFAGLPLI